MKFRLGYVSNSSSSSFILQLSGRPTSIEHMGRMLFGEHIPVMVSNYNGSIPSITIIERVYKDIIGQLDSNCLTDISSTELKDGMSFYYESDVSVFDHLISPEHRGTYDIIKQKVIPLVNYVRDNDYSSDEERAICGVKRDEICVCEGAMHQILQKSIIEQSNDTDLFIDIEYSDNDGSLDSYLEHSGILDKITLHRVSNH